MRKKAGGSTKQYEVTITRVIEQRARLTVTASSSDEAADRAERILERGLVDLEWEDGVVETAECISDVEEVESEDDSSAD